MDAKQFFDLVVLMRKHQREYFRSKGQDKKALQYAKEVEQMVDMEIKRVELIQKERMSPRLDL